MDIKLHSNASTTPRTRKYIQTSTKSDAAIASELNISIDTVKRWRSRDDVLDKSHRPKTIHKRLSFEQELLILYIRKRLSLSLDELLEVARLLINQNISRAVLSRCLKKYDTGRIKKPDGSEIGHVVVDCFQLPENMSIHQPLLVVLTETYTSHISFALIDEKDSEAQHRFADFIQHALPYTIKAINQPKVRFLSDIFSQLSVDNVDSHAADVLDSVWLQGANFNVDIAEILSGELFDGRHELGATLLEYEDTLNKSVIRNRLKKLTPYSYLKLKRDR